MMIEITTKDGSRYVIDPHLIACISRKAWKNLDSARQELCTIYWMGGGQLQVEGEKFEVIRDLWYKAYKTDAPRPTE